eukprot:scaffold213560_cov66-Attheya_sp.AAC.1
MHEGELEELPDVHIFNNNFFAKYDMFTNIYATAVRNMPHPKINYYHVGADYFDDPPNVNGQFAVLHHNFYGECYVEDVYEVDSDAEFNVLA